MLCPMCNGLENNAGSCPSCGETMLDGGRITDYAGPYAPYEPIAAGEMLGLSPEEQEAACRHIIYCPACGQSNEMLISQWNVSVP